MQTRPAKIDLNAARTMSLFAGIMALVVSVLPPVIYFHQGSQFLRGTIAASAELKSIQISTLIGLNPELWRFEALRVNDILQRGAETERYVVNLLDGAQVTEFGVQHRALPETHVTEPLFDAGQHVANLEVYTSLRPMLVRSLGLAAVTTLIGILSFIALRTLPLRLMRRAMESAAFLANYDPLTQLPNRALFGNWLSQSLSDSVKKQTAIGLLTLDLDRFKEVNDIFGHAAGDSVLAQTAERISALTENTDFLARMGGDEFCIVQTNAPQPKSAASLSKRIVAALSKPFEYDGNEFEIGVSIGISVSSPEEQVADPKILLKQSDLALYSVKSEASGSFQFFKKEMNERLERRRWLGVELQRAFDRGDLELYFQPQFNLEQSCLNGFEALCRWKHPEEGWISPDQFIPISEENGLILKMGDWVILEACRHAQHWPGKKVAVNVSPHQIRKGELAATIEGALTQTKIEPSQLEIEITEGVLLHNTEQTLETLERVHALGVKIAMDDFGTGFSSLSYLRKFAFDKIKIDRSFVADLGNGGDAETIIAAALNLGKSLGMVTNAEGIENIEQAEWLRQHGCDEAQGYFYGRPMPACDATDMVEVERWKLAELSKSRAAIERKCG